jgi:hypothetical protein
MYNNNKALLFLAVQSAGLLTSSYAQTTTPAPAVCAASCTTRDTAADFTIAYDGRCKPSTFLAKVTDAATHSCLICLYNHVHGTALTDINDVVTQMCLDGYAAEEFPYAEISQKGAQFDNEHYSGGGEWNYEVETATGEDRLQTDAARVNDIYYYQAQRKVIEHPHASIESFNPYNTENVIGGIQDLDGCDLNAAYCCFAQDRQAGDNNGNCATPYEYNCVDKDPADNTNICFVDHTRSKKANHVDGGFSIYGDLKTGKENIEGAVHCHGYVWPDADPLRADAVLKGNLLFYVSMYDHMTQRGYVRNIPGSPMCACAENMAVVTRADCTQVSTSERTTFKWTVSTEEVEASINIKDVNFNACTGTPNNNNLVDRARKLNNEGLYSDEKFAALQEILVGSAAGQCNQAIEGFLASKNIIIDSATATA